VLDRFINSRPCDPLVDYPMPLKHTKVFTTEIHSIHVFSPPLRVEMVGIVFNKTKRTYTLLDFFGTCTILSSAQKLPIGTLCRIYGLVSGKGRVIITEWEKTCFYGEMMFLGEVVSLRKMKFYCGRKLNA
ncbi:hypothetical protein THOM_0936, partial [Trachipleistophora hominis]